MKARTLNLAHGFAVLLLIGGLAILAGCGTTAIVHKPADATSVFDHYQTLAIKSSVVPGVVVADFAQDRIKDLVKANIASKYCPNRFKSISTKETCQDDLVLLINITTYDEGNRFGRFMLAGIGGMNIHSDVIVKNVASDDPISQAEVGKTFRWGGIYGAATDITDIEKWFAEEIAKTFGGIIGTGKPE
jgi:hypothetical protein